MTSIQSVLTRTLSGGLQAPKVSPEVNHKNVTFKRMSSSMGFSGKSKKVLLEEQQGQYFESLDARIFRIGRMLVEQQLGDFKKKGSLLSYVCCNDLKALVAAIDAIPVERQEDEIKTRDGAGASIIHIAYLFKNFGIGRYLVDRFPHLASLRYDAVDLVKGDFRMMPYLGENIMHIAIAHRAHEEVAWLINYFSENSKMLMQLLGARTFGHFFQPQQQSIGLYFGELPIHFAACSNDFELFDILVAADPNSIFFTDSYGNNVLHLCTLHQLVRMFDYIAKHAEVIIRNELKDRLHDDLKSGKVSEAHFEDYVTALKSEKILHVYNNDSLTPFTLAARMGKLDIFQHIMDMKTQVQWCYGPVVCSVVNLSHFENYRDGLLDPPKSIDTKFLSRFCADEVVNKEYDFTEFHYPDLEKDEEYMRSLGLHIWTEEEKPHRLGALEYICQGNNESASFEMLNIPAVREFIQKKWDRFGYPFFFKSSMFGIFRTLLITLIICFYEFGENDSFADWFIFILYPFAWVVMFFNFKSDIYQMYKYKHNHFGFDGTIRGAGLLENVCSSSEFVLFTLAIIFRIYTVKRDKLNEDSSARTLLALTTLVCWIRILYIFMGFERTGNFVIIVANIVMNDIPLFLWIYVTILFGFGSAHAALSTNMFDERTVVNSMKHYFSFIWNIFRYTVDGQNNEVFDESLVQVNALWIYQILSSWYNVLIVLLLLNLLIAMLSETYSNLIDKSQSILLRERYNMMCSFEKGMYDDEIKEAMQSYLILRPHQAPVFEMQTIDSAWSKKGNADTDIFDESLKGDTVDMPENVRNMAATGDTNGLEKELIRLPKLVNCRDVAGGNLLHWSVSNGWYDTVDMLLSFSIDVNVCDKANKDTIMHDAVEAFCTCTSDKKESCAQIIKLLIQRGACYTRRNAKHLSPLDIARQKSDENSPNYDAVMTLFKEGSKLLEERLKGAKVEVGESRITSKASFNAFCKLTLLIIDPQVDFHPGGSLAVPTANEDAVRIQRFIREHIDEIKDIIVTQDSHHLTHIAHGAFWEDKNGNSPSPFTSISFKDVCQGKWIPKVKDRLEYCKQYTKELEGKGKFVLTIWPEHCLLGTPGHCVVPPIDSALQEWSRHNNREVEYVMKGMNSLTEMYSALEAEVPIPDDMSTQLNSKLLRRLQSAKQLVVCGQALSHCVNFTLRDIVKHWRSDISRIHLMRDGTSSVPTFEADGEEFVEDMKMAGVKIVNSTDNFIKE